MLYKILTLIFVIIFYIIRLPFVLLKDIALVLYTPFDIERFWTTYQNALVNFNVGNTVFKKHTKEDYELEYSETEEKEKTTVGFKIMPTVLPTVQSESEAGIIPEEDEDY